MDKNTAKRLDIKGNVKAGEAQPNAEERELDDLEEIGMPN